MTVDRGAIEESARLFRNALEQSDLASWPSLADFPRGSCGDAALLLGQYLREAGLGDFDYVCGSISDADGVRTHAWLQCGALIIDITADQFDGIDASVLVTEDSTWHARFDAEPKQVAG